MLVFIISKEVPLSDKGRHNTIYILEGKPTKWQSIKNRVTSALLLLLQFSHSSLNSSDVDPGIRMRLLSLWCSGGVSSGRQLTEWQEVDKSGIRKEGQSEYETRSRQTMQQQPVRCGALHSCIHRHNNKNERKSRNQCLSSSCPTFLSLLFGRFTSSRLISLNHVAQNNSDSDLPISNIFWPWLPCQQLRLYWPVAVRNMVILNDSPSITWAPELEPVGDRRLVMAWIPCNVPARTRYSLEDKPGRPSTLAISTPFESWMPGIIASKIPLVD